MAKTQMQSAFSRPLTARAAREELYEMIWSEAAVRDVLGRGLAYKKTEWPGRRELHPKG